MLAAARGRRASSTFASKTCCSTDAELGRLQRAPEHAAGGQRARHSAQQGRHIGYNRGRSLSPMPTTSSRTPPRERHAEPSGTANINTLHVRTGSGRRSYRSSARKRLDSRDDVQRPEVAAREHRLDDGQQPVDLPAPERQGWRRDRSRRYIARRTRLPGSTTRQRTATYIQYAGSTTAIRAATQVRIGTLNSAGALWHGQPPGRQKIKALDFRR